MSRSKAFEKSCCEDCGRTIDRRRRGRHENVCDSCSNVRPSYDSCNDSCHDSCHNSCNDSRGEDRKWRALDTSMCHPFDDSTVDQEASGELKNVQQSIESIIIKDSCDVNVTSSDIQAALNVQVALQVAIAIVISISIADGNQADDVTQDLFAKLKSSQVNKQQVFIENSRGVEVSTSDTDIAINVQVLLQILIALVVRLDIL